MQIVQQLLFVAALGVTAWLISKRVGIIKKTIQLGKAEKRTDRPNERLATMLRVAFAQKKMFDRPVVGLMHFVIYAGFLLINVEVLEIVLDGIFGTHRLFAPILGGFYPVLINFFEFLAVGVLAVCVDFSDSSQHHQSGASATRASPRIERLAGIGCQYHFGY